MIYLIPIILLVIVIVYLAKLFLIWWRKELTVKCDYCDKPNDELYNSYAFDLEEFKGPLICENCARKYTVK